MHPAENLWSFSTGQWFLNPTLLYCKHHIYLKRSISQGYNIIQGGKSSRNFPQGCVKQCQMKLFKWLARALCVMFCFIIEKFNIHFIFNLPSGNVRSLFRLKFKNLKETNSPNVLGIFDNMLLLTSCGIAKNQPITTFLTLYLFKIYQCCFTSVFD